MGCNTTFVEMYSYSAPGSALKKKLRMTRTIAWTNHNPPQQVTNADLEATYAYDNEGRMTATQTRSFNYGNPPGTLICSVT